MSGTASQINSPSEAVAMSGSDPVECFLPGRPTPILTTRDDWKRRVKSAVGPGLYPPRMQDPSPTTLFPYQLPSGIQVVGNIANFVADHGTLMTAVELNEDGYPVDINDPDQEVVSRLPSGRAVVETFGNAQRDGGTVLGKIIPFQPEEEGAGAG